MSYTLHPEAHRDVEEACRRYRKNASGSVVVRSLDEFDRIARALAAEPDLGTPAGNERASFRLNGFPYTVICKPTGKRIRVLVVRHQHRDPVHGQSRR